MKVQHSAFQSEFEKSLDYDTQINNKYDLVEG